MAIDLGKLVAGLEAEYLSLQGQLATLPAVGSYSLDGLSVSAGGAHESIMKRMVEIEQKLAGLGFPIGTLSQPFQVVGRLRG